MPQDSATLQAPPQLFALTNGGTTTSTVQLAASAKAVWSDASVDTLTPGVTPVKSAYTGASPTVDTLNFVWIVFLIKGAAPLLMKEVDFPTQVETVLNAATWMPYARIDGPTIEPYHPAGSGFPAGVTTGDTPYFVAGTGPGTGWVILPIS